MAQEVVIWQQSHGYGAGGVQDFGPSQKSGTAGYALDSELADDIDIFGTINRVEVHGYGSSAFEPSSTYYHGVNVRIYSFGADNKPGGLQAEYFIAKDSAALLFQNTGLGDLRVRLEPAFQATGKHYIVVQPVIDPVVIPGTGGSTAKWYWRSDSADPILGEAPYFRADPAQPWTRDGSNDGSRNLSLRLWGTRTLNTPPAISQISKADLPLAGRLKISGSNFGTAQGTGRVRINGAFAPVSSWSETSITAYVPDTSKLGQGTVEVVTDGGTSNTKPITIRARPSANGRVQWRFQADDPYIQGRPAVGTDGTIYAAGVKGHLYALTPDGGVKWIFRGSFPVIQSVSVDANNVAYFAGGNVVYAINPDGTLKWQIVNPSGAAFIAGPNVGPDGNIYAVANLGAGNANDLGAITISSTGEIVANRPGYVEPEEGSLFTREIVFGSGQLYFGGLNNVPFGTSGLEALQLGGIYRFTAQAGGRQPAVAPDGTIYASIGGNPGTPERLGAYSPLNGGLMRTILPNETYLGSPDIGSDGTIYIVHNLSVISAYTPTGENLWNFDPDGITGDAIVNRQNTIVSAGGYEIGSPGSIYGLRTTGQSIWTIKLPAENGGYVRAASRARFTSDGNTVYYGTSVNDYANDIYSYLYAVSASPDLPCSVGLTPDRASYQYNGGSGSVVVAAVNSTCKWTATSSVSWITVYNSNGVGDGTVLYTVTANPGFSPRTGTIEIGGQTFTVDQGPRTTSASVGITSPANGDVFTLPTSLYIAANAVDTDGTIDRVEFFANNELVGTDTSAPYQVAWDDMAATTYTLAARSVGQDGSVTLSEPVMITVYPVPPPEPAPLPIPPPTLTAPTMNQVFAAGESVIFAAVPAESQYPTERVDFYLDTLLIGSDENAPYSVSLDNVPAGIYTASARTVAITGAQATSQLVDIRINTNRSGNSKLFDYDGDGRTDISVFRPADGNWYLQRSAAGLFGINFGFATDKIAPADYDGDGKTDVAVFRPEEGIWYIANSADGSYSALRFGLAEDLPAPADYDGDGKADLAVFRPSDGTWYIRNSSNGTFTINQFGTNGDLPTIGDFDGDGKADIAVYRPSQSVWYHLNSSNGTFSGEQFGFSTDKIVPADYDSDGKTDIGVYRPSQGIWYIKNSSNSTYRSFVFGLSGDVPAVGDFDGDGKADMAVFRPSDGYWYIANSSNGTFTISPWGQNGDIPTPAAFTN